MELDYLNYKGFDTRTFGEIFPSETEFAAFYNSLNWKSLRDTGDFAKYGIDVIYFLLASEYCNEHIASYDENKFKLQVMRIIYEAGPAWQKAMVVNEKLIDMQDADIHKGSRLESRSSGNVDRAATTDGNATNTTNGKNIVNNAEHPDATPSTSSLEELEYISSQQVNNTNKTDQIYDHRFSEDHSQSAGSNTQIWTKDNIKGWVELLMSIDDTICSRFIYRFKKLFTKFTMANKPPLMFAIEDNS